MVTSETNTNTGVAARVATNVASSIADAGESLYSVAQGTGIPLTTLRRKLAGTDRYPLDVADLALIAGFLGTTPERLFGQSVAAA